MRARGLRTASLSFPAGSRQDPRHRRSLEDGLYRLAAGRDTLIVAVGGGVTGDLAGFLASIWHRGVPLVQVPTSLLAMVDASIGGKTGSTWVAPRTSSAPFHQPWAVYADVTLLGTLPTREYLAGFAEVVKAAASLTAVSSVGSKPNVTLLRARQAEAIEHAVERSVEIKARIVGRDEREHGRRAALNFGHTLAHAAEALCEYRLAHGEAVAAGLCLEARLATELTGFPPAHVRRLEALVKAFGLPSRLPREIEHDALVAATARDKKARSGRVRYALPRRLGRMPPGEDPTLPVEPRNRATRAGTGGLRRAMNNPERIGPYRVLRPLDRSRDPRVFLVAGPSGSHAVVEIAALEAEAEPSATTCGRFRDAAARLAQVRHAGLARLLDFGSSERELWWASEWIDGTALDACVGHGGRLDPADAVELIALAAEALAAAHDVDVVHGAIRPSRLLRTAPRAIQVVGFRPGDPGGDPLERAAGAVGYLSPEQVHGPALDARSDLFSLAAVLYGVLTGSAPFPGESEASTLYRIVHEPPVDPAAAARPVGPELRSFLLRALSREPAERYPTAAIFAEALRRAGAAEQVEVALGRSAPELAARGGEARSPRALPATRSNLLPFIAGACLALGLAAVAAWWLRGRLGPAPPPPVQWLDAEVRTEPAGLEVRADGASLDPPGRVRFAAAAPYPLLSAHHACRVVERRLDPADAGTVVVLVADPVELDWTFEPAVAAAEVVLDGKKLGTTPLQAQIDLCRAHRLELRARGHRPAQVELAAGVLPLDARKQLFDLALEPIPQGRLTLPAGEVDLVYWIDGARLPEGQREIGLEEGTHEVRYRNDDHWIEGSQSVTIRGGAVEPLRVESVALATLVVQAFPPNCKVYLKRDGQDWRYLDETPAERRVAAGAYQVKVVLNPTGQEQVREVSLAAGANPPVRVSFGAAG